VAAGLPVVKGSKSAISIERQVRIGAGSLVLIGVILGFLIHPAFFGLTAFIGAGLVFAGVTDWCGMGLLLARAPWNR
jgi:predicted branched-subunit amino acid permease